MAVRELTEALPQENRSAAGSRDHTSEFWAPPLAPTATAASADTVRRSPLRQVGLAPETRDEAPEQSELPERKASFASQRKLIAGAVIVTALGMSAWFFWPSASEKTPRQEPATTVPFSEPSAAVPSTAVASVDPAPSMPERSAVPSAATAAPDVPSPASAAAPDNPAPDSPQADAAAPIANAAAPQTIPASQTREIVFLQRPGVNIRTMPSLNGAVVGTAPKGTRFTATSREEEWVQVEGGRWKGWINSQFVGANPPR
jgi:hypothetical protein